MAKFMLLIHGDPEAWADMSPGPGAVRHIPRSTEETQSCSMQC